MLAVAPPLNRLFAIGFTCWLAASSSFTAAELRVGTARVDITPEGPIRLSGYAVRKAESEGVEQRLWAKALAIGEGRRTPCLLITVDNVGVPAHVVEAVAARLREKAGLPRENVVVSSSHTHTGPCLGGALENLFVAPVPADQQATIDRYTASLMDRLVELGKEAVEKRRPARLFRNEGRATFAANRRTAGGPVDHAVPVLCVKDRSGKVVAVVANYACHCTTLGGEFNRVCGDWAGYAQEAIERAFPGSVALITIGCGADANPHPRGSLDLARQHGEELAGEVRRMLEGTMLPVERAPAGKIRFIDLPFDPLPTRTQWEERAKEAGIVGYHAKRNLERLDRGERLPTTLRYPVQAWAFGDRLGMVFLGGEVVVDYALRLKRELDAERLWVTAYANDVPCYIPSRRILQEGGYEAETSLWYYDRPARLSTAVEDQIIETVTSLLPAAFKAEPGRAEFPPPRSPVEALAAFRTSPGLRIELAASEPHVVDPVAIDWDAAGRLWVVEMHDYPMGMDGNWKAGGRVKRLEDRDGDGHYERSTLFLDGLPFPTGITCWSNGVLVCAAPDILYAEDRNGDGVADNVTKLFSGFATNNYQARVNSLSLGLDNWIYGANGLIGGAIHGLAGGREVNIRGRDFRWDPATGTFEPASGLTQQGRVRDDFDNWFGCDNSTLLWHYPFPEHYAGRNPHVAPPEPRVFVPSGADPNALFPTSRTLERFNDPGHANRTTSACGLGLYRDDLMGAEFAGNAFVCEPVHNLVHRLKLQFDGVTFRATRAAGEERSEFLTSTDNWFRPAQVRTGPDGALWVVDMYRFVIEHPRWISPERLAKLDVRAGSDMGRIYRILPQGEVGRPIRDLRRLPASELARLIDTPNGTDRDRIHTELLRRRDLKAAPVLESIARDSIRPATRVQALAAVDGLGALSSGPVLRALNDPDERVRRLAVRWAERFAADPKIRSRLLELTEDPGTAVRHQVALTLGEMEDTEAALGRMALKDADDVWIRAAVLSSAKHAAADLLVTLVDSMADSPARRELLGGLVRTVLGQGKPAGITRVFDRLAGKTGTSVEEWQLEALAPLLEKSMTDPVRSAEVRETARQLSGRTELPEATRVAALKAAAADGTRSSGQTIWLRGFLSRSEPAVLQRAAISMLERRGEMGTAEAVLEQWDTYTPGTRAGLINVLLSRDVWITPLLAAVRAGEVSATEIPAAERQRLSAHSDGGIRRMAEETFPSSVAADRRAVVARYSQLNPAKGNPERGAAVFRANCASCHALGEEGHAVGPDLTIYRAKPIDDFVVAVLDPSRAIEPRFLAYEVETRDGRTLTGVLKGETATAFTLIQGGGKEETLLRQEIERWRASSVSLMPDGLETALPGEAMADLFAFLAKVKPDP